VGVLEWNRCNTRAVKKLAYRAHVDAVTAEGIGNGKCFFAIALGCAGAMAL